MGRFHYTTRAHRCQSDFFGGCTTVKMSKNASPGMKKLQKNIDKTGVGCYNVGEITSCEKDARSDSKKETKQ